MKIYSKFVLGVLVLTIMALGACSRTKDALGTDTIENLVTVGVWESVLLGGSGGVDQVPEGGRAEFSKQDHLIHYYDMEGNQIKTESFSFASSKRMTWNGTEYEIRENFVSSTQTMTLIEPSTKTVAVSFHRKRQ
ncbi:hypothetical protein [Niabella terrae]